MPQADAKVRLTDLNPLDEHELREALPDDVLQIEELADVTDRPGTRHEPLVTAAVIILSAQAIKGLTAWLLKKRHRKRVEIGFERIEPDGTTTRGTAVIDVSESQSEEAIVRAVGETFGADPAAVGEALAGLAT